MKRTREDGIALIVVLSVLTMLIVIATPFLLQSKKDHANAAAISEKHRARQVSQSALEWSKISLQATHQGLEAQGLGRATPWWDGPDEFKVDRYPEELAQLAGLEGQRYMGNPRGDMWTIHVRDESGFINANSATPFLWSALVGRTQLTKEYKPNDGTLQVASTEGFAREQGEVVVAGRVVSYRSTTDSSFTGVKLNATIPAGALVMNGMAMDLAMLPQKLERAGGGLTSLASLAELKKVASFSSQALSEEKLGRILGPMTHVGFRPSASGWLAPQAVSANVDPEAWNPERFGQPVRVRNPEFFNAGTLVRLADQTGAEYHVVTSSRAQGNGGVVYLKDQVSRVYEFGDTTLEALQRHPVNINHCSREVLVLLLDGLAYVPRWRATTTEEQRVSSELAGYLADLIIKNRPIRGMEHLVDLLAALYQSRAGTFVPGQSGVTSDMVTLKGFSQLTVNANQIMAVVQNALNPNHRSLLYSTMPFDFVSHDYFTVDVAASVNDGGGTELAYHRFRETFRSAPARELRYALDTQADFEGPIVSQRSGRYVETYPNLMSFFTGDYAKPERRLFRYLQNLNDPEKTGCRPSRTEGDVRLQPARLYGGWTEHFDGNLSGPVAVGVRSRRTTVRNESLVPDGLRLNERPYELDLNTRGQVLGAGQKASAIADKNGMNPFVVEFFMKPSRFSSGQALFSALGRDVTSDFIRAWYDPSERAFRFQVHDMAQDDVRYSNAPAVAEVKWTPPGNVIEDDTWYHFSLHLTGTKPGEISLHVDGIKRGETRYKSTLVTSFSETATQFQVEDARDWPSEGAFLVGTEVVQATRQGNTFTIFQNPLGGFIPAGRGARGTVALSHPAGETVTVFGYSSVLRRFQDTAGEVLSTGGASLASDLAPFSVLGIGKNGTQTESFVLPGPPPLPLSAEVLDLATANSLELAALPTQNLGTAANAFQTSGGYAIIVGWVIPSTNPTSNILDQVLQRAAVMVRYTGRNGNMLTGLSAPQDSFNPELVDGQPLSGAAGGANQATQPRFFWRTRPKIITRFTAGGSNAPLLAQIFPISVHLTSNNGYKGPEFANNIPQPEYLQLGQPLLAPTLSDFSNHAIEWVAYYGVDRQNSLFLCHRRDFLRRAVDRVFSTRVQNPGAFNPNNPNDFKLPDIEGIRNDLRWRAQADTAQFGWTNSSNAADTHRGGSAVLPTFRVSIVGGRAPGYGDAVSVMTAGNASRESHFISWGWANRACLTSNVTRTINQIALPVVAGQNRSNGSAIWDRRLYARLCKFPSGELPWITASGEAQIGGDLVGGTPSSGLLDEIRVRAVQRNRYALWDDSRASWIGNTVSNPYPLGLDANATSVPIVSSLWVPRAANSQGANPQGSLLQNFWLPGGRQLDLDDPLSELSQDAGLVLIGDEIIAFRGVSQNAASGGFLLTDCVRGFMNTQPATHAFGEPIVFLDFRATSRLVQSASRDSGVFTLAEARDFGVTDTGARAGGLVLMGRELIHFTEVGGNTLRMPTRLDARTGERQGIFRGRFGTRIGSHSHDDIVVDMPFRYWDRYAPQSNDPELAFFEFSVNEPRSFFKRILWHHRATKPRLGLKVLVRFDPRVPWETPPQESGGALVLLDARSGQGQEILTRHLLNRDARGVDVRVFFTYEPNAFDASTFTTNDWKETAELLDIELRYLAAPFVLSRETLK